MSDLSLRLETSVFSEGYVSLSAIDALDTTAQLSAMRGYFSGQFTMLWHNENLTKGSQQKLYRNVRKSAL